MFSIETQFEQNIIEITERSKRFERNHEYYKPCNESTKMKSDSGCWKNYLDVRYRKKRGLLCKFMEPWILSW